MVIILLYLLPLINNIDLSENVQFVAKVSKVKTRTKGNKDYYTFRLNIPKEISQKLHLKEDDYLFIQSAIKAKWYHLLKWEEMTKTWNMLPQKLQQEIQSSGMITAPETNSAISYRSVTSDSWHDVVTYINENFYETVNVSGVTNVNLPSLKQRKLQDPVIVQAGWS